MRMRTRTVLTTWEVATVEPMRAGRLAAPREARAVPAGGPAPRHDPGWCPRSRGGGRPGRGANRPGKRMDRRASLHLLRRLPLRHRLRCQPAWSYRPDHGRYCGVHAVQPPSRCPRRGDRSPRPSLRWPLRPRRGSGRSLGRPRSFGTGLARYEQGFGESRDLLLASLERGSVGADGEAGGFFRFREVPVVPRPATGPRPPVAVAATSTGTVEQAAARGLPLILGMHATDDEKAALLARYASVAARYGHDPDLAEHMAVAVCHIAYSRAGAVGELRATMPAWIDRGVGQYISLRPSPQPRRDPGAYVQHLLAMHPVGTPEYCAERLTASVDRTGIRHILLMLEGTGQLRRTVETIERVGSQVVPRLGSPAASTG